MTKLTLTDITSLSGNPVSAANLLNLNFAAIEAAIENTLSRDGTGPNYMDSDLDMNDNRVYNLPRPTSDTEPLRLGDLALITAGSGNVVNNTWEFSTRVVAQAASIPSLQTFIRTAGYRNAGDRGGALYKRVLSAPSHGGYFTGADGTIWEICHEGFVTPEMFGAYADGTTYDDTAITKAILVAYTIDCEVVLGGGSYRVTGPFNIDYSVKIRGLDRESYVKVENGQTTEGFLINASKVTLQNFTILVNAATDLVNGSGHCGTCVTVSKWFVPPNSAEPSLVRDIVFDNMVFKRAETSQNGHAVSIMSRSSHISFHNCEWIGGSTTSCHHASGILTHWGGWSHGVNTHYVDFDGQTSNFTAGATVTGLTSGARGYIVYQTDSGSTGTLFIKEVVGTFIDNETITDNLGGSAIANGASAQASSSGGTFRQARFEPLHYSYHPNNVRVYNSRVRNTLRFVQHSSSYDIDVDGCDYFGTNYGNQLIDLVVGDESDTFAGPDDYGKVYRGFNFRNIRAYAVNGLGSSTTSPGNSSTAIDLSGLSTSKQTAADLAAYNSAPYTTETYKATQYANRQPTFGNVLFENITYDYGEGTTILTTTPINTTVYIRNTFGHFTFSNVRAVARRRISDSVMPLSVQLANCTGSYAFNNCYLYGGLSLDKVENVTVQGSTIIHPDKNDYKAVEVSGDQQSFTTSAAISAGATTLTIPASAYRINKNQRLKYSGGVVYTTKNVEPGETTVFITAAPAAAGSGATVSIDQRSKNVMFSNCDVSGGDIGMKFTYTLNGIVKGGSIRDCGRYGINIDVNAYVEQEGTLFSNNGVRRYLYVPDAALSTRDVCVSDGMYTGRHLRFLESTYVLHNVSISTDAEKASLEHCQFQGTPITAYTTVAALSNGAMVVGRNNVDALGAPVFITGTGTTSATWTPIVKVGGSATGVTMSTNNAYYVMFEDKVYIDADITLSSIGGLTGSVTIEGLPFTQRPSIAAAVGQCYLTGVNSGTLTGAPMCRITGTAINLDMHSSSGTGGTTAITNTVVNNTTRIRVSGYYTRS